ncbi:Glycosyltransferase involved in cell wall bisynthesis [Sharpea azabuensis]|uniref:glycosyltransferase family 4 protein n=1 Tax=Sharpea azabuensis TaxID=322505 RepID=UPI0008E5270E|nr:glycosyltransferase family 4 protein [Sharpea azabuensis]SFD56248.1 Glycosyltransferase involved in cell wall bisynthesis [Sharpea azabuensis]SFK56381.1 Glycosyltransferase involved in cell wall bisynthesis [Sharpea azabuensis]
MKNKTICIFSAQYLPHMGGVERYTYNIAKECLKRGHRVIVVTSANSALDAISVEEGVKVYRLPSFQLMNGRLPILKYNRRTRQLFNVLKNEQIDFCIVNTRFYFLSLSGMKFAYENHIPLITVEHGTAYLTFNNALLDFIERKYERAITRKGKKYCQHYYAVSEFSRQWLKEFGIEGEGVLYNSINPDDYKDIIVDPSDKLDGVTIAYTGRLIPEKGVSVLLEAFSILRKKYENIYLILVGEGPLETQIKQYNDDHIHYLGRKDNKDVIKILKNTDIFCLPSRSEGFSTSILEAALTKCCIITTKRGGSVELITDDRYGIIIEDNRLYFVKEALERVIKDGNYRETSANNVYKRVIDNFTWKQCVDEFERVMKGWKKDD